MDKGGVFQGVVPPPGRRDVLDQNQAVCPLSAGAQRRRHRGHRHDPTLRVPRPQGVLGVPVREGQPRKPGQPL